MRRKKNLAPGPLAPGPSTAVESSTDVRYELDIVMENFWTRATGVFGKPVWLREGVLHLFYDDDNTEPRWHAAHGATRLFDQRLLIDAAAARHAAGRDALPTPAGGARPVIVGLRRGPRAGVPSRRRCAAAGRGPGGAAGRVVAPSLGPCKCAHPRRHSLPAGRSSTHSLTDVLTDLARVGLRHHRRL